MSQKPSAPVVQVSVLPGAAMGVVTAFVVTRMVAPFSRGYEPTGLAPDDNYEVAALVHDTLALHTALGGDDRFV